MILMYHKIYPENPTIWWVDIDNFYRQMCELQAYEVVYLDDYNPDNPKQVVISFDGIYDNIYYYAAPILKHFNYPFELFITSDYLDKNNTFDQEEPLTKFASIKMLTELKKMGARLQWHTRSHQKLINSKTNDEIKKELIVPEKIKKLDLNGFKWLAYPYGEFNQNVINISKKYFHGAVSCNQGDNHNKFQLNRLTVTNQSSFKKHSIGVIIPCYNYGSYLIEAVESTLRQTRPVDQILIADDHSNDNTQEISQVYQERYPKLINYLRNEKNLGIVANFNHALKYLKTDYFCFLGADNRFRSDYIEKTSAILDKNDKLAIVYTDFVLFGPKASNMYTFFPKERQAGIIEKTLYLIKFPDFNPEVVANLKNVNFMHGSSLIRRQALDEVGAYKNKRIKSHAEDHDLFYRMIQKGWLAQRVAEPLLEYRQHSLDQANTKLNSYFELNFYRNQYHTTQTELLRIQNSKFWKLLNCYKNPKAALKKYLPKLPNKIKQTVISKLNSFFK